MQCTTNITKGGNMKSDNKTIVFQVRITKELKESIDTVAKDLMIKPSQAARMILALGVNRGYGEFSNDRKE